jgi:mono/diheme cytochrome c family protein
MFPPHLSRSIGAPAWCLALLLAASSPAFPADGKIDFNRDIRPLISNACIACHGPDEKERKAKLRLDTPDGASRDLGGYAAMVPGKPDESELLLRLITDDEDEVMPPKGKGKRFTPDQVALVRKWIEQGGKYDVHWSYAKPVKSAVPAPADAAWARNEIDRFLLARLEKEGLKPMPDAAPRALARRVALDLTGLPPTWAEVESFVNDPAPDAYERFVDAMLKKSAFGEHWAGTWLDLARYADSSGYPSDQPREIWGYRDWVIGALNRNLSFDQFTIEQIAGDLLPAPTDDQLIATAFHRNTMTQNEGGTSDEEFRTAAIVDRVNTTLAVWMGTTMACAQCHTHKYDPITHEDYFKVFAILNQSADADRKDETPVHSFFTPADKARREGLQQEIDGLEKRFTQPGTEWLKGLAAWDAVFPRELAWQMPKPAKAATDSAGGATIADDGTVTIGKNADTAAHTVEIPLAAGPLSAVKLETKPSAGFGNFVITGLRAELIPPSGAAGPAARYVRVELPGKAKMLQLAEVEVMSGGANAAVAGKASHSSQYQDAEPKRANDGKTDGDYAKGSVSHTAQQDDPWWEVDLGTARPVDRIVVWNRTDGGTANRLEGFRVIALDAARKPVWESGAQPAPGDKKEFGIGGPTPLTFTAASADHEQPGFPAASLLKAPAKDNPGWAIGGATDRPHHLTLMLKSPSTVAAGSTLRVVIDQKSTHKQHLLGSFRLGITGDARVAKVFGTPAPVLAAVRVPAEQRSDADRKTIADYYVRNVAPENAAERGKLATLRREHEAIKPATVPIMQELAEKERRKTQIQRRGNWQDLGDEVTPGVPAAFHPLPEGEPRNRLGMARWLVSRENPLTARVTVNRFWEGIFGVGIVRTSEEFGAQGELPFHPELLDWLAVDFMDHGWDVKRLLKQLVTSRAYRQDSRTTAELNERDPDNRLVARGPRFRPSGELLRDQALAAGGLLSARMSGPSVRPIAPNIGLSTAFGRSNDWVTSEGEDRHRRSVYTEVRRNGPYASFSTFDAPNREVCTIRRGRTNTPLQAFVTMNDPVFVEANQSLARRLLAEVKEKDASARIRHAFRLCLSRDPDASEIATLGALFDEALAAFRADTAAAARMATEPIGPAPEGADVAELAAWAATANVIMNLDEFLMRR